MVSPTDLTVVDWLIKRLRSKYISLNISAARCNTKDFGENLNEIEDINEILYNKLGDVLKHTIPGEYKTYRSELTRIEHEYTLKALRNIKSHCVCGRARKESHLTPEEVAIYLKYNEMIQNRK